MPWSANLPLLFFSPLTWLLPRAAQELRTPALTTCANLYPEAQFLPTQDLLKAADRFGATLSQPPPLLSGQDSEETLSLLAAARKEWNAVAVSLVKPEANGNATDAHAVDQDELDVAELAVGWSRAAAGGAASSAGDYGIAGLAASVLVCSCSRWV